MATSETSICNSALAKLGAERILSLSDNTKAGRLCNEQYEKMRDEVLRSHPWNFAIARVELAALVAVPLFEYDHQFQIPADSLRILDIDINIELNAVDPWAVEGDKLLANEDPIKIKYIKRVTNTALFDANFVEALAFRLAADLAYAIVQSLSVQRQMFAAYKEFLRPARSFDAQEGKLDQVRADEWFNERL